MGCFKSCVKCLSLVPWASLIALVACWAGTALFCGTGHEALTSFLNLMTSANITGFSQDTLSIDETFRDLKYSIYGIAPFMFVVTILLLTDGILATRTVKREVEYTYRSKKCGVCCGIFYTVFIFLLSTAWLLISVVTGFALYFFIVSDSQCQLVAGSLDPDICINFVQAGLMPYMKGVAGYGILCGEELAQKFCEPEEFKLTYQMVIITFAGSCITVLSLKQFLMALSANYAYVKMSRKLVDYQDTKFREQMELNQIIETARSNERLTFSY